jgi:hypothetical protein
MEQSEIRDGAARDRPLVRLSPTCGDAYHELGTIGLSHGVFGMKKRKPAAAKKRGRKSKASHPGMMGDGTEEQSLGERGNPALRIRKKEVVAAFGGKKKRKK